MSLCCVYVINKNGNPLMPCHPSKARKLLRDGKAKCIRRTPFTIKLLWDCEENVQELTLGIDSGSKVIGSAVRDNTNKIYYLSEIYLRQDVKSKMDQRRMYRRTRRSRKTRYRKARFLNRRNSVKNDRYPPTIISKFQSLLKELWFVYKLLPVKYLIIETATFDPHALQDPSLVFKPWKYSKGLQFGYYNVKQYVLDRDKYTCQHCKGRSKDSKLNVHHILQRNSGGSDRPNNLVTLCKSCHDLHHSGKISINFKKQISTLSHATHMNIIQSLIRKNIPNYQETYGYITKVIREYFGIVKSHCYDACCVHNINLQESPKFLTNNILIKKCINKGSYQRTHGIRSEKLFPKDKILGFKRYDKVIYNNLIYFIKGRMSSGYAILSDIFGNKINLKPIPKFTKLKRISARKSWIMTEYIIVNS